MLQFARNIGIDYSGPVAPESSCKGLRVYVAGSCSKSLQSSCFAQPVQCVQLFDLNQLELAM